MASPFLGTSWRSTLTCAASRGPSCGSFARQLHKLVHGLEIVILDINMRYNSDILTDGSCCNFLKCYAVSFFDIIGTSSPHTEYAPALSAGVRNLFNADRIANATLNLIRVARACVWFLENFIGMLYEHNSMPVFSIICDRSTCLRHCVVFHCAAVLRHTSSYL